MSPQKHVAAQSCCALPSGTQQDCAPTKTSRLWLWVLAAFALQLVAWTAWLVVASKNKVAEVPLAGAIGGKR